MARGWMGWFTVGCCSASTMFVNLSKRHGFGCTRYPNPWTACPAEAARRQGADRRMIAAPHAPNGPTSSPSLTLLNSAPV